MKDKGYILLDLNSNRKNR